MAYDFTTFKNNSSGALEWLRKEYLGIRSGQANPAILDAVKVEVYGSPMLINQLGSITISDPRSLRITPWDKSVITLIDSAIRQANIGVSVSVDEQGIRVAFPQLTADTRQVLIKLAKQKHEEARVRLRNEREKVQTEADKQEKSGSMGKDDVFRAKQELQKLVDEVNKKLDLLYEKKEKEILE